MVAVTETSNGGRIDDEAALVAAARGGNTSCFEALVSRYERNIYRLAKSIAKNESDAVTQEAILQSLRAHRRLQRRVALLHMARANHRQSSAVRIAQKWSFPVSQGIIVC